MNILQGEQLRRSFEKTTKLVAGRDLNVTQRGSGAFVQYDNDGNVTRLNIPMVPDDNVDPKLTRAIQGFIDHEVAHVFYTDPHHESVERRRIARENEVKEKWVHSIFNVIEDARIEILICRRFRGSEANLNGVREFVAQKIEKRVAKADRAQDNQMRGLLFPTFIRARAGQTAFIDLMARVDADPYFEPIDAVIPDLSSRIAKMETSQDMTALAEDVIKAMLNLMEPPELEDMPPMGGGESGDPQDGDSENESDEDGNSQPKDEDHGESEDDAETESEGQDEQDEQKQDAGDGTSDNVESEGDNQEEDETAGDGAEEKDDAAADENSEGEEQSEGASDKDEQSDGDDTDASDEGGSSDEGDDEGEESSGTSGEDADDQEAHDDGDEETDEASSGDDASDDDGADWDNDDGEDTASDGELDDSDAEDGTDDMDGSGDDYGKGGTGPDDWTDLGQEEYEDMDEAMSDIVKEYAVEAYSGSRANIVDFSRDWDMVFTPDPDRFRDINPRKIEETVRQTVGSLQKDLQRLIAARSISVKTPGFRSGRLNGPSLHRLIQGDDRIFARKQVTQTKKVAVSLLVDCSGSMSSRVGNKSAMQIATESAWAFAETLERLGVTHEVMGFTTPNTTDAKELLRSGYGCEEYTAAAIRMDEINEFCRSTGVDPDRVRSGGHKTIHFKGFEEKFSQDAKRRLACAHSRNFQRHMWGNFDAIAVREAMRRLMLRQEERKILFVFSDGMPSAELSPGIEQQALKENVQLCERMGIETIGIGIASDSVNYFYPKRTVVSDVTELPKVTMLHLREALLAA